MQLRLKPFIYALFLTAPTLTLANGFQVWPQNGSAIGDYAAGTAANPNDVNAAYYNAGAINYFSGQEASFSAVSEIKSTKFKGTITPNPAISGYTPGKQTQQGGQYTFLPSIMYVAPISEKWAFGLSLSSPFRNDIDYGNSPFTRYNVTKNDFNSYDIGPSLAFKPMPKLSFGIGFDAIYTSENFSRKVTTSSTANESISDNKASGWGFGYHVGMFWKATPSTNVGLSYRSSINVDASGPSDLTGPVGSNHTRLKYDLELPSTTILSVQQTLNKQWQVMGSAVYTDWSHTNNFTLKNVATSTGTTNFNLVNNLQSTWRFILGSHYHLNQEWMFMGALGYDESATKKSSRNIIIPDANSFLVSLGAKYQISSDFAAEVGYTHLFNDKASINNSHTSEGVTYNTAGDIHSNSDLLGLEFDWKMT